ncbi:spindle assembly checkpoint component Mad1 [Thamnocephalis sphaerospora]|uniref:Spindle assembly checkpoint component MAD1 n=1 Tax=Thamnocephalis sphaerospora TaxID=78915 RepID=A0A4P9XXY8_9FUNG|nr:spindle assembly checkpoint component Mad1 [Thamnocephalis sphaerospora]|eukprot:RKP10942.1 spindle assembly checkpoint component Mad1 [Thamnocephalis sphaerospora]
MNPPSKRHRTASAVCDPRADNPFLVATPASAASKNDENAPPSASLSSYTGAPTTAARRPLATVARPRAPTALHASGYPATVHRPSMLHSVVAPTPGRRDLPDTSLLDSARVARWLDAAVGSPDRSTSAHLASQRQLTTEKSNAERAEASRSDSASPSGTGAGRKDLEALEARNKASDLAYQLAMQRSEAERKLTEAATFAQRLQQQLKEKIQRIEKLETDRRYLFDRANEADTLLRQSKDELEQMQAEKNAAMLKQQRENARISEQLHEMQEAQRARESGTSHQLRMLQTKVSGLEDQLAASRSQLQQQMQIADTNKRREEEAHEALAKAEQALQRLRVSGEGGDDADVAAAQLRNQTSQVQALEERNRKLTRELEQLRVKHRDVAVLEEEKLRLEARAAQVDAYRQRCDELEAECIMLRKEKEEWAGFSSTQAGDASIDSPYKMSAALASQRFQLASLTERQGALQAELRRSETALASAEAQVAELEQRCRAVEAEREQDQRELKRYQHTKVLAQKEVAFLREQLKSYDLEEATHMAGNYDAQKTARIEQLEQLLDEYKQRLDQKASAPEATPIKDADASKSSSADEKETLQAELEKLRKENASLQRQTESLDREVGALEQALGRGDYDRKTTRVLQFVDNPAKRDFGIRENAFKALKEENQQLLNQLEALQASGAPVNADVMAHAAESTATGDVVPRQCLLNAQQELRQLEEQLAVKNKRMQRLKEVFAAKGREFREAVYSLLGYKLDFLENGRVRLTSAYASRDDDSFLFRSDEDDHGTMELLGSGNDVFARSLAQHIRVWVAERGSIPAFLSAVTLELVTRQSGNGAIVGMRTMDMANDSTSLGSF